MKDYLEGQGHQTKRLEWAERWIEGMKDIYTRLKFSEERKIKFVIFQLKGPAKAWWKIIDRKWELDRTLRS